jgi:HD-GYP domain-containing protein (c-di-GMP phosphodiesterase class II)
LNVKSEYEPKCFAEYGQYWGISGRLDTLFRTFPDILFLIDGHGMILDYHAGDPSLLYLPAVQFLGKKVNDVLPKEVADLFIRTMESVRKTGEVGVLKYQLQTAQGDRWFDARLVQTTEAQFIAVARDVTEHESTMERVRQQLRQLSALHAIDAAITASFDQKVTLSVILREILNQLHVDAADILLFNPHLNILEFAAGQGFRNPAFKHSPIRIGQGGAGTAALEHRTVSTFNMNDQSPDISPPLELEREGFVSYYAVPLFVKGQIKGVMELYHRQSLQPAEDWLEFLSTLAQRAALAIDSGEMFQNLQKTGTELGLAYDLSIEGWLQALEISGREDREHTRRMAKVTVEIAHQLGISDPDTVPIRWGALLHDIGSFGIPESILCKAGPLSAEERAIVEEHPRLAVKLLQSIPYLAPALDIPRCHHECWDGSGYPEGIQGEQIPMPARIFAVVDVFDALTSSRPYRPAWSENEALEYVCHQAGKQFDPNIVKVFLKVMEMEEKQLE